MGRWFLLERWGRLPHLLGANVLFASGLFVHAFLYNFYLERLGYTPVEMGRAQAALTAGGLLALLPAGRLVDRAGSARAALLAALTAAAGLVAGALAERAPGIYAAALVAGAGAAAWRVAGGPLLLAVAPVRLRTRAFSWNVALLVGAGGAYFAASGALPGVLEARAGLAPLAALRAVLLAGGVATALGALLYARLGAPGAGAAPVEMSAAAADPGVWSDTRIALAAGAVFVWMLAAAAVQPFFNLYFTRVHHLGLAGTGLLLGVGHVATAAALFASAELAARRSPGAALRAWLLALPLALAALMLGPALAPAALLYLVQGMVAPATNPLIDQLILERVAVRRRGAAASWRNAATEASGVAGAAAGGSVLHAGSFGLLFGASAAVGLLGAAVVALGLGARRRAAA